MERPVPADFRDSLRGSSNTGGGNNSGVGYVPCLTVLYTEADSAKNTADEVFENRFNYLRLA